MCLAVPLLLASSRRPFSHPGSSSGSDPPRQPGRASQPGQPVRYTPSRGELPVPSAAASTTRGRPKCHRGHPRSCRPSGVSLRQGASRHAARGTRSPRRRPRQIRLKPGSMTLPLRRHTLRGVNSPIKPSPARCLTSTPRRCRCCCPRVTSVTPRELECDQKEKKEKERERRERRKEIERARARASRGQQPNEL